MIQDIVSTDGSDLGLAQTDVMRAANILSVQIGELEYADDFGVDLKYFIDSEFKFQNSSFKSYLVQRLLTYQVNVQSVVESVEKLFTTYSFGVSDPVKSTELIL